MTDHRTAKEIERDIETERASLTDTLEDLQERLSIDGILRQVGDQLRTHGGDIGASLSRSVRDNPMALALTGAGLAWMMFGNGDRGRHRHNQGYVTRHRSGRAVSVDDDDDDDDDADHGPAAARHHDSRPGMNRGMAGPGNTPDWVRNFDDPYDTRSMGGSMEGSYDNDSDDGPGMGEKARDAYRGAGARVSGAAGAVGDRAKAVHASASQAGRSARDGFSHVAEEVSAQAGRLREQFSQGTETLGQEARTRVVAARERAYHARTAVSDHARQGVARAVDLFDDQPLIAGGLALAVGAAIGAALPRTRIEDRYMGGESDALIHEAERIFAEERDKVGAVAQAAMDEAGTMVDEAKGSAKNAKADADRKAEGDNVAQDTANKAAAKVEEAGQRIADAARSEAERQKLGQQEFGKADN